MQRYGLILVTVLLAGSLFSCYKVDYASASGTIYIRADGSIDPPTSPIYSGDNVTYTLTDNVVSDADGIVIERDSIVIDGSHYAIQGTGAGVGLFLLGRSNVTIENMSINTFEHGVVLDSSNSINIVGNKISNNNYGVWVAESSNNSLFENNITNNAQFGVRLSQSSYNVFRNNHIAENYYSFDVNGGEDVAHYSQDVDTSNMVNGKPMYYWVNRQDMEIPSDAGYVALVGSTNITVKGLELRDNGVGVLLAHTNNSIIADNNLTKNHGGICLYSSTNNTITRNILVNNTNSAVLYWSLGNTISRCQMIGSISGIYLALSSNGNVASGNYIASNWNGFELTQSSSNTFYHNNLINNTEQVHMTYSGYASLWDDGYPSGGNYWSDYSGLDLYKGPYQNETGSDGKGDTPYIINANNTDHYPLVHAWSPEMQVVDLVNGSRAYGWDLELEDIALGHPDFRSAGSIGANETASLIKGKFESFGLETWLEPYQFTNWSLLSTPSLHIDEDGNPYTKTDQTIVSSFQCEHYSWPTPEEGTFADLVILPLPPAANHTELGRYPIDTATWNTIDTNGKIVLIGREVRWASGWWSTFINKIYTEPPAGIVYAWWYEWMNFTPPMYSSTGGKPLFQDHYWNLGIPSGFVNYEDGLAIRESENTQSSTSANVTVNSVIGNGTHYNVVGKITGSENPEKLVIISGHYDTVMCSGFCDNGAGTAGVMELAKVFAEAAEKKYYQPKYTLLFVCFTGEEMGLVGSAHYVKQHKSEMADIVAVINLDGIGGDNLYVSETPESNLQQTIMNAAEDLAIPISQVTTGGSDQESFRVPSTIDNWVLSGWGVELGISDATPVKSSAIIISFPLLYSDLWNMGTPGWMHTAYDNSTSTGTLNWVEEEDLGEHIKVAALTIVRISSTLRSVNLALLDIANFKTVVGQGYRTLIDVTVENQGNLSETFNITVYANATAIETKEVTLTGGTSTTTTFTWNTAGFAKGNYTMSACVWPVPGETHTDDNTLVDGIVIVGTPGNVNGDSIVNMLDLYKTALNYGKTKPYGSTETANCDIDDNGIINMLDLYIAAVHFGQTDP